MKVVKLRVVPDVEEDVFRDIEIGADHTFEELYRTIINAFSFRGDQLASFYMSNDEWDKGHEIALMDMGGGGFEELPTVMSDAKLGDMIKAPGQKVILVYDFLKMWCFYLETLDIKEKDKGDPEVVLAFGDAPKEDEKEMPDLMEGIDESELEGDSKTKKSDYDYEDDYDDDDFDSSQFENIDDLDI